MKIAFVQNFWQEYYGIMYLSSCLKLHNHECCVFIKGAENDIVDSICDLYPDLVGFSVATGSQQWALDIAGKIKNRIKTVIIFGGPHVTFCPEIIMNKYVDIVCIGEGIEALVELVDKLKNKEDITKIRNLWVKIKGQIYKNNLRPLVSNLDLLPLPDWSLYDKFRFLRNRSTKTFIVSIGCPFDCAFCSNHAYREIYYNNGRYFRHRSVFSVIRELEQHKKKYNLETVTFADEIFTLEKKWLKEFLYIYGEKINLPFFCSVRADTIDEEIIKMLKKAGCYGLTFGIETGNETLRNKILKKNISNEQYVKISKLIKENKLILRTTNMFCLPSETVENAFETVKLNIECKVDNPFSYIYQPLPNTQLFKECIEKGILNKDFNFDDINSLYFNASVLKIKDKNEIINIHNFFYLLVKFPGLSKIIKLLVRLPNSFIYKAIFLLSLIFNYKIYKRLSFLKVIQLLNYNLRMRFFAKNRLIILTLFGL